MKTLRDIIEYEMANGPAKTFADRLEAAIEKFLEEKYKIRLQQSE